MRRTLAGQVGEGRRRSQETCKRMTESIETVIVGGGQAGLAMSYHLQRLGREHIVLERGRIAERWRSERWDSLASVPELDD